MRRQADAASVFERLIADERSLPAPELDWKRLEAGILAQLSEPGEPRHQERRPLIYLGVAAAAALTLVATALLRPEAPVATAPAPEQAELSPGDATVESAEIDPGGELRASESMHVEHAGRAHWTLARGSRARVRNQGSEVVIELEAGSVEAEVDPGQSPETFAVEAGDVRVAVHGTKFRVERQGAVVDVSVREGVVSVSTRSEPTPMKLIAPAGKRFAAINAGASRGAQRAHAAAPAITPPQALAEEPSIGDVEAGVSRIQTATQACFTKYTAAREGLQVSVRSNVIVSVRPDGGVAVRAFDPPLAPSVDGCTRAAMSSIRFTPSRRGIELARTLDLKR